MTIKLLNGDCREMLKALPSNSVDACVTDPPYGLSFMGKAWDYDVPGVETWREVFRVLKPGAHLLSFFGSRTYHRGVIPIEDAGFEIRDQIMWHYASGFPKSYNISKVLRDEKKCCTCDEDLRDVQNGVDAEKPLSSDQKQDMLDGVHRGFTIADKDRNEQENADDALRGVRGDDSPSALAGEAQRENVLQLLVPGEDLCGSADTLQSQRKGKTAPRHGTERAGQSGVEGRGDLSQAERELREREVRALPPGTDSDGAQRRLRDGTPPSNGALGEAPFDASGVRAPSRPQAAKQPPIKLRTVAEQSKSQDGGTWENCDRCGKPNIPTGFGTALKPAHEPIVVARKPFSGTVAKNMLAHGTGGLNIDGCRVEGGEAAKTWEKPRGGIWTTDSSAKADLVDSTKGRWPANVMHDGSDEVLNGFPDVKGGKPGVMRLGENNGAAYGAESRTPGTPMTGFGDEGSAARFFYCAKTSKRDRDEGLDLEPTVTTDGRAVSIDNAYLRGETLRKNNHPTVKPTDLMRYLCRLVTPPGGTVLDPFMGSGSTGKAAILENFNFIGVELSPEYLAIAKARIYHSLGSDLV